MAIANASMLDEATAAAEAMTLAKRSVKVKSNLAHRGGDCHPQTIEVIQTRAEPLGLRSRWATRTDELDGLLTGRRLLRRALQYPTSGWHRRPARDAEVHPAGAFIVAADLLALTLLKPPGEMGADIVVGNTQRFGVPMGFGGPHAAYMACRDAYKRSMPGRLVGVSCRRARQAGLPPGAADARAAHPPREGHLQHLHRAGAAGGDGQHVRRLPRPARASRASRSAWRGSPPSWPPACAAGLHARARSAFDTLSPSTGGAAPTRPDRARWPPAPTCAPRQRLACASRWTKPPPAPTSRRCVADLRRRRAALPSIDALDRQAPSLIPAPCAAPAPSSPTRCSTATTARHEMLRYIRRCRQGPGAGPQHDPAGSAAP
jgi:glycine dehydrogenase